MAQWLIDTNILVRLQEQNSPHHRDCVQAILALRSRGDTLFLCTQVAIEYYVVATRPAEVNGLGKTPSEALQDLQDLRALYLWLPEPPAIDREWERLINRYTVIGRQAHDARLVALMTLHSVDCLLTLNKADFQRYLEIRAVSPSEVLAGTA